MQAKTDLVSSVCNKLLNDDSEGALSKLSEWPPPVSLSFKKAGISDLDKIKTFRRDQFTCRYCGTRTIFIPTLRILSLLFPKEFPYQKNWKWTTTHSAYWELGTSCDHLFPNSRGGSSTDPNNLMTACYKCQTMKMNWTIQELRWTVRDIATRQWDGLTGAFVKLMDRYRIEDKILRNWRRIIER